MRSFGARRYGKVVNNDNRQRNSTKFESAHTAPLTHFPWATSHSSPLHRKLSTSPRKCSSTPNPPLPNSVRPNPSLSPRLPPRFFSLGPAITALAESPRFQKPQVHSGDYPPRKHRRFILTPGRSGSGSGEEWKGRVDTNSAG
jgi:hypothetical protein